VLLLHNAHHFLGDPKKIFSQGRVKMRGPGDRYIKPAAANNPSIRQVYFLVIATKIRIKLEREREIRDPLKRRTLRGWMVLLTTTTTTTKNNPDRFHFFLYPSQ
jgi:hypothetical protein